MAKQRKDRQGRALRPGECQQKDGRYLYNYTDPNGIRGRVYAKTLAELREKEKELLRSQLDGIDLYAAGKSDLNFVFDRYIQTKTELSKTTLSNYSYMYDHFVRQTFGKKKIANIKYSDVLFFYQQLIAGGMKVNSLETIHTVLHPTFQMAVRDDIIRKNPSDGVMKELKSSHKKNIGVRHALTLEEQTAFLDYVRNSEIFCSWAPLFTVLLGTGCRIGEALGLRWEDLDYDKRMININHALVYYPQRDGKTKCDFIISMPKTTAGIRNIPMLDEVLEAFLEEYEKQKEEGFNMTVIDGMTGFVFKNRFGNVFNAEAVNRAIRRIYTAYNAEEILKATREHRPAVLLPHFSCHHLRHTFCTRLCEKETNLKVIQAVMGHANIETTMDVYVEATDEKKTESMKNLAKKLNLFTRDNKDDDEKNSVPEN